MKIILLSIIVFSSVSAYIQHKNIKRMEAEYLEEYGEPFSFTFREWIDCMRYTLFKKLPKE